MEKHGRGEEVREGEVADVSVIPEIRVVTELEFGLPVCEDSL